MHTKRFRLSILFFCLFLAFITLPYGQSVILNYIEAYLNNYLIDTILNFVQSDPQIILNFYYLFKNLFSLFLSIVSSLFFVIAIASYIIHLVLKKPKKIIFIIGLILSIALLIINPLISISINSYTVIGYLFDFIATLANISTPSIIIYIFRIINVIISLPQISFLLFFIFVIFVTWTSEIKKGFKILITVSSSIIFLIGFILSILNLISNILFVLVAAHNSISLDLYIELIQIKQTIYIPLSFAQIFFIKILSFGCILGVLIAILKNSLKSEKKYILFYLIPFLITSLLAITKIFCKAIYIILMIIFINIYF